MNGCIHGMGRAEWCSICTPAPKLCPVSVPRVPKARVKGATRTRKVRLPKLVIASGKTAPQETIVFRRETRVVTKVVTKMDYTTLCEAILAEKANRPYLNIRELARVFSVGKNVVHRVLHGIGRTNPVKE